MSVQQSMDPTTCAKYGFLLGVGLFLLGALAEVVVHAGALSVPAWEEALFFDLEVAGVVIGLFAPLAIGVVLPLVE